MRRAGLRILWPPARSRGRGRVLWAALLALMLFGELTVVILPVAARVPARQQAMTIAATRLRAAPASRAEPLVRLPEGATVTVFGKPERGWYRARHGRLEGYLPSGEVATAPVSPGRARKSARSSDGSRAVELEQGAGDRSRDRKRDRKDGARAASETRTAAELNLRASPSREATVLAVIPRRETVMLSGKHEDGFVELTWNGQTGWALGKHLAASRGRKPASKRDARSWSRRELKAIIFEAADRYGQPREDMLRVARCESDLVPTAVNGPGGSYGLFQFKPRTWLGTPFAAYDIFDPRASAHAAAWMWSVGRRREWVCQ